MATRCKFTCLSVTKRKHWNKEHPFNYEAEFSAVTSGSDENDKFFAATPSGTLKVSTIVDDIFVVGNDYYLDISPAD